MTACAAIARELAPDATKSPNRMGLRACAAMQADRPRIVLCCGHSVRRLAAALAHVLRQMDHTVEIQCGSRARATLRGQGHTSATPTVHVLCVRSDVEPALIEPLRQGFSKRASTMDHVMVGVLDLRRPLRLADEIRTFADAVARQHTVRRPIATRPMSRVPTQRYVPVPPPVANAGRDHASLHREVASPGRPMHRATRRAYRARALIGGVAVAAALVGGSSVLAQSLGEHGTDSLATAVLAAASDPETRDPAARDDGDRARTRDSDRASSDARERAAIDVGATAAAQDRARPESAARVIDVLVSDDEDDEDEVVALDRRATQSDALAMDRRALPSETAAVDRRAAPSDAMAGDPSEMTADEVDAILDAAVGSHRLRRSRSFYVAVPERERADWVGARKACRALTVDDVGGFRLPYKRELQLLAAAGQLGQGRLYWSATSSSDDADAAWAIEPAHRGDTDLLEQAKDEAIGTLLCIRPRATPDPADR